MPICRHRIVFFRHVPLTQYACNLFQRRQNAEPCEAEYICGRKSAFADLSSGIKQTIAVDLQEHIQTVGVLIVCCNMLCIIAPTMAHCAKIKTVLAKVYLLSLAKLNSRFVTFLATCRNYVTTKGVLLPLNVKFKAFVLSLYRKGLSKSVRSHASYLLQPEDKKTACKIGRDT